MTRGDMVDLSGYDLMAAINYIAADAVIVVVHNNSSHFLLFVVEHGGERQEPLMAGKGRFVAAFKYFDEPGDMAKVYGPAVRLALNMAVGEASDGS